MVTKATSLLPNTGGTALYAIDLSAAFNSFFSRNLSLPRFDATSSSWLNPAGLAAPSQPPVGDAQASLLGLLLFSCHTFSLSNDEHNLLASMGGSHLTSRVSSPAKAYRRPKPQLASDFFAPTDRPRWNTQHSHFQIPDSWKP